MSRSYDSDPLPGFLPSQKEMCDGPFPVMMRCFSEVAAKEIVVFSLLFSSLCPSPVATPIDVQRRRFRGSLLVLHVQMCLGDEWYQLHLNGGWVQTFLAIALLALRPKLSPRCPLPTENDGYALSHFTREKCFSSPKYQDNHCTLYLGTLRSEHCSST